ncbi:MAG: sortase [Chloroflexota bacterium]
MPSRDRRNLLARVVLALIVGAVAALPAPSLAAAPTPGPTVEAAAARDIDDVAGARRAGGRSIDRLEPRASTVGVAEPDALDLRLGEIQPFLVARFAAEAAAAEAAAPTYSGKNHFWIPSLGVSRSVETFACTRSTPPANRIYRWGCAGTNNVYIFGHAWGVMKPLHDAYVSGEVKVGMTAVYADGKGRVRTYRVTEIRVVTPDKVDWAIAAQAVPSMTLQTCVGANSERRLLVRLVAD